MGGIGNDIIWLPVVEHHRCDQPRYYQKILSPGELSLFKHAPLRFREFLWLIWSIKESVYKCERTEAQTKIFSPTAITLEWIRFPSIPLPKEMPFQNGDWEGLPGEDWCKGEARLHGTTYTFHSLATNLFIYTVATAIHDLPDIHTGIRFFTETPPGGQSGEVRRFLLSRLGRDWPSMAIGTVANAPSGYPYFLPVAGGPDVTLSFTHHGPLVSYAFTASHPAKFLSPLRYQLS